MKPQLSVVILSYNTRDLLDKCIYSVYQALKKSKLIKGSEIIVVDNASTDGSVDMVKRKYGRTKIIENRINEGFAKANNKGIRASYGDFILLLNSDTEVSSDIFDKMVSEFKKNPDIGALGCKILNPDLTVQPSAGFIPDLFNVFAWMFFLDNIPLIQTFLQPYHADYEEFYSSSQKVGWVSGACMMVKNELKKKNIFLDEKIFMYGEEVEWCYRIKKAGFDVYYTCETSIIHHKGASSFGRLAGIVEEFKTLLYFYKKHQKVFKPLILRIFLFLGALLRIVIFGIIPGYSQRAKLYVEAISVVFR